MFLQFDGELWFLSCFQLITNISVLSSSDSGTNFHKNSKKISLQQHSVCDRSCIWWLFLLVNKPNHNFDPVIFHKKPRKKFYTIPGVVWEHFFNMKMLILINLIIKWLDDNNQGALYQLSPCHQTLSLYLSGSQFLSSFS